jgi:DDE superfamily endonuclease
VAKEAMVHPRASERRIPLAHGGRTRSLRRALRPEVPSGLLRRDALPDGGTEAHPRARRARASDALRLRIRTQGDSQHLRSLFEPKARWRHLEVTERRSTAVDFAQARRRLADEHYPEAEKVRVVLDNLNTHTPASLYKAFEPQEARRLLPRLEFHHTPKHASWLNQVEIELSVLFCRQCLSCRIPDESTLKKESTAWQRERNEQEATVSWRLSAPEAREKLKRLYPPRP